MAQKISPHSGKYPAETIYGFLHGKDDEGERGRGWNGKAFKDQKFNYEYKICFYIFLVFSLLPSISLTYSLSFFLSLSTIVIVDVFILIPHPEPK